MKVLIVGGGGREHAIAWAVAKSPRVDKIYAAPGNAGIAEVAECEDISVMDAEKLVAFAKEKEVDFVIVAPDDPLAAGVADAFLDAGIKTFGPRANAAIIEASKAFSKDLMKKYDIPSAAYEVFEDYDKAAAYLDTIKAPYVLKADGLALGKGVLICQTKDEALEGLKNIMVDKLVETGSLQAAYETQARIHRQEQLRREQQEQEERRRREIEEKRAQARREAEEAAHREKTQQSAAERLEALRERLGAQQQPEPAGRMEDAGETENTPEAAESDEKMSAPGDVRERGPVGDTQNAGTVGDDAQDHAGQDPGRAQEEKIYKASFWVAGTKDQLKALADYIKDIGFAGYGSIKA